MLQWIDTIIQGILLGGLYALFAAGLSLIFGIMRLVNLAHGDLIILAAFVLLALTSWLGINPFVAALIALPLMFVVGFALQFIILNRALGRDILPPLLVTFGISIIIENGLLEAFSADSRLLRTGDISTASIQIGGGIALGVMPVLTFSRPSPSFCCSICYSIAPNWAAPFARPPTICKLRNSWASGTLASLR